MDAYQQSHRYTRPPLPPPPSMADHHYHHQPPPPPRQTIPQQGPWYSGQFQYQPSSSPPPPPPPPPPHQQQPPQWAPSPHSDHLPPPSYPAPHHNPLPPYTAHHPLHNQFTPPPRPHMHPPPPHPYPPHSQISQSYSQVNQEWGNPNWTHHQGWEYPVHNNEEDWAAKARAWAAAKTAMDNQHPQSQFAPVGRLEEHSQYHDQYAQVVDPHYPETQQQSLPASSYQQFPVPTAPSHRPPVIHLQESASISAGVPSYVSDGRLPYTGRDGTLAGDSNAVFSHQENLPTSPTVHQQEVPSSYSSVTGKEDASDQTEQLYKSLPLPIMSAQEGQHHVHSSVPAVGRSVLMEQPFAYGNQSADFSTDLADQPLDFAPRFNRDHDPHMQSSYDHSDSAGRIRGMDPVAAVTSIHTWTPPVAPGVIYPPIHPGLPSGPQHDPSVAVPSPVPGHAAPVFGRIPGPSFQATIPSVSAPFSLGAGTALHSTTSFPADAYGVSSMSERPKKASVPNWLREEIIKKKAVMASSVQEHPKEETQSIEDEGVDKSFGKNDQADSKSIDSSRSTEEEDDDEDYVEAARTAAINQEIKRVLTEVLLKVTDELFDEIATKVLNDDDLTVEVDYNTGASNHRLSPSPPAVPTPKASAKVLIPVKAKETETKDVSGKSSSSSPGDVLGLSSYASDDDDDEIQSPSVPNSRKNHFRQHSSIQKHSEDIHDAVENGGSQAEIEHIRDLTNLENDSSKTSSTGAKNNHSAVVSELEHGNVGPSSYSKIVSGVIGDDIDGGGEVLDGIHASESKYNVGEKVVRKPELPGENVNAKKSMPDDSQGREARIKSDKNDRYEAKRSSAGKDFVKDVESGKIRADERGDENRGRQDERQLKKEKMDDWNGSKERRKEHGAKPQEKAKESDSRKKFTHLDVKEDKKEMERGKRASAKEDNGKKRERLKDEKEDRSRHKPTSDSSRHKRRRSPSSSSRGRNGKDNSVLSHANDSSDETSEDSKRKVHSKRRDLSPSPVRSRRRQVSRSPHSKHSQRRHSPYSSLETTRKRRSRSKSPVRRQR
ncbi:hypothetical protein L1049_006697 [Liquidambar formosana]|uniref:Uncharacterized protein n=1 Tax=Liquidambar formosana TaxID=63359 RepID=A0AAP0RHL0_LIQFO